MLRRQAGFVYVSAGCRQSGDDGVIRQSPPPDPNADFFETLRWQMSAAVRASAKFPIHAKLARRAYTSPLPFRDTLLEKMKKVREEYFQGLVPRAGFRSSGFKT